MLTNNLPVCSFCWEVTSLGELWERKERCDCGWWECVRNTREAGGKTWRWRLFDKTGDVQSLPTTKRASDSVSLLPNFLLERGCWTPRSLVFIWTMTCWERACDTWAAFVNAIWELDSEAQVRASLVVWFWHRCWLTQGFHFWTLLLCCSGLMRCSAQNKMWGSWEVPAKKSRGWSEFMVDLGSL